MQTLNFRAVATFPGSGAFDEWWVTGLAEGDFAIVASSSRARVHLVARVSLEDERIELTAIEVGVGRVIAQPIASLEGLTVALDRGGHRGWDPVGLTLRGRIPRGVTLRSCF